MSDARTAVQVAKALASSVSVLLKKLSAQPRNEQDLVQCSSSDQTINFLEVKLELLLSYCIDVTYCLLLQAEGQYIAGHPCIEQMIILQGVISRLKPLDAKLKHHLDRLITLVTNDTSSNSSAGMRPQLANFVAEGSCTEVRQGGRDSDNGHESPRTHDDEDADEGEGSHAVVYRAPKLSSVPFEEDSRNAVKEERRLERMRGRIRQSEMLQSVRSEVLGTPEEVVGGSTGVSGLGEDARSKVLAEDKEIQAWEEDNFMRRQVTKKDRQRRKRLLSQSARLETIADVGELAMVWGNAPGAVTVTDADRDEGSNLRSSGKKNKRARF